MQRRNWIIGLGVVAVLGLGVWALVPRWAFAPTESNVPDGFSEEGEQVVGSETPGVETNSEPIAVVAENLEVPWGIDWLPNGAMLVTERPGRLLYFLAGERSEILVPESVRARGESGLLGVAVHPGFADNRWVYLYRTTTGEGGATINTVERYELTAGLELENRVEILGGIPGAQYHDGGALAFGPDGYLYVTAGDAGNSANAQDLDSLAGKILRVSESGEIPPDNPFGSAVWSWGHRNPQGIAWDDAGVLWSSEHGRSGLFTGLDELNRIDPGRNYGLPVIEGDESAEGLWPPVIHSGPDETWAPASLAWWEGKLFFGGLRGQSLYEADTSGEQVTLKAHLREELGRIRAVAVGPDGALYISTSNRDGRGKPKAGDDKILRIAPGVL